MVIGHMTFFIATEHDPLPYIEIAILPKHIALPKRTDIEHVLLHRNMFLVLEPCSIPMFSGHAAASVFIWYLTCIENIVDL